MKRATIIFGKQFLDVCYSEDHFYQTFEIQAVEWNGKDIWPLLKAMGNEDSITCHFKYLYVV